MRVLHVISGLDARTGGPTVAVTGLALSQSAAGADVGIVSTWRSGDERSAVARMQSGGVHVREVGPASQRLRRHPQLRSVLDAAMDVDVIHIHGLWEEIQHLGAFLAARRGIPYVITPHGMLTSWSLGQSRWQKKLYRAWRLSKDLNRASAIHYITQQEKRESAGIAGNFPDIVEPIGIDLQEFASLPAPGTFRRRFPKLPDRALIVFLGRIHPGKGLEHLVPAMAQVPEAILAVVGPDSGGYRKVIEELAQQHAVLDRVLFTGMLKGEDRIAALADADLFCMPSDHENFGLAVIEALASGTPVIVSPEVGTSGEIVVAGVGSAVPRDPQALASELRRWLDDAARRNDASAKAPAFVRERYDWRTIAAHWLDHYTRLAGRAGSRREVARAAENSIR